VWCCVTRLVYVVGSALGSFPRGKGPAITGTFTEPVPQRLAHRTKQPTIGICIIYHEYKNTARFENTPAFVKRELQTARVMETANCYHKIELPICKGCVENAALPGFARQTILSEPMVGHRDRARRDIQTQVSGTRLRDPLGDGPVTKPDLEHIFLAHSLERDVLKEIRVEPKVPFIEPFKGGTRRVGHSYHSRQLCSAKLVPERRVAIVGCRLARKHVQALRWSGSGFERAVALLSLREAHSAKRLHALLHEDGFAAVTRKGDSYLWARPSVHVKKLRDLELKAGYKAA
jgi:hypothetical protein